MNIYGCQRCDESNSGFDLNRVELIGTSIRSIGQGSRSLPLSIIERYTQRSKEWDFHTSRSKSLIQFHISTRVRNFVFFPSDRTTGGSKYHVWPSLLGLNDIDWMKVFHPIRFPESLGNGAEFRRILFVENSDLYWGRIRSVEVLSKQNCFLFFFFFFFNLSIASRVLVAELVSLSLLIVFSSSFFG